MPRPQTFPRFDKRSSLDNGSPWLPQPNPASAAPGRILTDLESVAELKPLCHLIQIVLIVLQASMTAGAPRIFPPRRTKPLGVGRSGLDQTTLATEFNHRQNAVLTDLAVRVARVRASCRRLFVSVSTKMRRAGCSHDNIWAPILLRPTVVVKHSDTL